MVQHGFRYVRSDAKLASANRAANIMQRPFFFQLGGGVESGDHRAFPR
jgi:hypothetical protein